MFAKTAPQLRCSLSLQRLNPVAMNESQLKVHRVYPNCGKSLKTSSFCEPRNTVIDSCVYCSVVFLDATELKKSANAFGKYFSDSRLQIGYPRDCTPEATCDSDFVNHLGCACDPQCVESNSPKLTEDVPPQPTPAAQFPCTATTGHVHPRRLGTAGASPAVVGVHVH